MSDCHRGAGDDYDNFSKNKYIYLLALHHYYYHGFTYIELGDGDEMWEVDNFEDIISTNLDVFKLLTKFYNANRLIMLYGNHDIYKKYPRILEQYFYKYHPKNLQQETVLLTGLKVYESLILNYQDHDIFLIHGHQADYLNSTLWKFSQFLVKNLWRPLEKMGISDPTSAAKNYQVAKTTEKKLSQWSSENNKILIAGHTHRPIFPKQGQSLYFNDGSCLHPDGITCIEIEQGRITLVKWKLQNNHQPPSVERKLLVKNEPITNFYK